MLKKAKSLFTVMVISTFIHAQGVYDNSGGYLIVPSGGYLITQNFTIGSSGSFTAGGNISVSGDWTNNKGSTQTLSGGLVTFNGSSTQQITGNNRTDFNNLTVASGAAVEVPASKHVNVNGILTMTGSFTLLSSATYSTASLIDAGSNSGNLTVHRHLTGGKRLHFVSSPVHNGAFTSIYDNTNGNYNVYWYDETNTSTDPNIGWTRILSGTLTDGLGYTAVYDNWTTRIFTGTLNTSSDIGVTITNTSSGNSSADGWNLVGNPYPSAVSCSTFVADNSLIDGTLYFWDSDTSGGGGYSNADYASWNGSGSAASGGGQQVAPNGVLAIGQAFFVKKSGAGSGTLYFKNSQRMHTTDAQFFTPELIDFQRIKLSVTNDFNLSNEIIIAFRKEATDEHDRLYDGIKLKGNPNLAFYSIWDEKEYVINSLPEIDATTNKVIPLGLDAGLEINHQIKLLGFENIDPSVKIYLEDRQEKKFIDLAELRSYEFIPAKGTNINRFFIHINPDLTGIAENHADFQVYSSGKTIYLVNPKNLAGNFMVTDMMGKILCKGDLHINYFNLNVARGYYLIHIQTNGNFITKKIFIQ
ncbi:MAG: T9SS type A sorting domain-containing protein [Sphingobacteriales bacterium]|nr:T9SS type A sorting domain-containing protein [Sphingobacteriales bacterium]